MDVEIVVTAVGSYIILGLIEGLGVAGLLGTSVLGSIGFLRQVVLGVGKALRVGSLLEVM